VRNRKIKFWLCIHKSPMLLQKVRREREQQQTKNISIIISTSRQHQSTTRDNQNSFFQSKRANSRSLVVFLLAFCIYPTSYPFALYCIAENISDSSTCFFVVGNVDDQSAHIIFVVESRGDGRYGVAK
jgi:hypothetical protein